MVINCLLNIKRRKGLKIAKNNFVKIIKFKGNYIYKAFLGCGEINNEGVVEKVNIIYPDKQMLNWVIVMLSLL